MDPATVQTITHSLMDISHNLRYVGAGSAISALGGVGTGIGIVFAAFIVSFARQPAMEKRLLPVTWLAFALAEAMGLFALLFAFIFMYT